MKTVVLVTGGFDPIHSGHVLLCNSAKTYGDYLIVGVNSDAWLGRKKGAAFMPWIERASVMRNLKAVDEVISFHDDDGTAIDALEYVKSKYPGCRIVFANGGDRTKDNIPEMVVEGVDFVFGVGGEHKQNSSSWILQEWKAPKTERVWGYYRILHDVPGVKVKELTVEPGRTLSMQKHFHRNELWFVAEGQCVVLSMTDSGYNFPPTHLTKDAKYTILQGEWHQLTNPFKTPCKIIEIQYGGKCDEDDIVRK